MKRVIFTIAMAATVCSSSKKSETAVAESYQKNYPELTILCEVPYEAEGNVIGVAKGNADLLKYVNEAIAKAKADGSFDKYVADAVDQAAGNKYEGMLDDEGNGPADNG